MLARFRTDIEKRYLEKFPKFDPTPFYVEGSSYSKLLMNAMGNNTPVTQEELVGLWGEEKFKKQVAYLKEWEALPEWIEDAS